MEHSAANDGIQTTQAARPVGSYPHARRVGRLLFLSGIGPRQAGSNTIAGNEYDGDGRLTGYDIEQQVHAVFANVRAVLGASGASLADLADVTVFLTDMAADFATMNRIWAEHFPDPAHAPCRTTVAVSALPTPIAVELKCIAVLPEGAPRD